MFFLKQDMDKSVLQNSHFRISHNLPNALQTESIIFRTSKQYPSQIILNKKVNFIGKTKQKNRKDYACSI